MYSAITAVFPLIAALSASAETFTIKVGDGGLAFNPTSVNAKIGDTIAFQFVAKNHSVTQSTFASPCTQSGIDSGFQLVPDGATSFPEWSFTLNNDSAPLWFFCAQTNPVNHCQQGMVFAVNPTAEKSFDAYKANALASNTTSGAASNTIASDSASSTSGALTLPGTPLSTGGIINGSPTSDAQSSTGSATSTGTAATQTNSNAAVSTKGGAGILVAAGLAAGLLL